MGLPGFHPRIEGAYVLRSPRRPMFPRHFEKRKTGHFRLIGHVRCIPFGVKIALQWALGALFLAKKGPLDRNDHVLKQEWRPRA